MIEITDTATGTIDIKFPVVILREWLYRTDASGCGSKQALGIGVFSSADIPFCQCFRQVRTMYHAHTGIE